MKMKEVAEVTQFPQLDPLAVVRRPLAVARHRRGQEAAINQVVRNRKLAPRPRFVAAFVERLAVQSLPQGDIRSSPRLRRRRGQ